MPAYVIAVLQVTDEEEYDRYRQQTPGTLALYGGKFIARGGHLEVLEGDWEPTRVVLIEFDSVEQAKRWWTSPEYEAIKPLRQAAANSSLLVVEGVSGQA